MPSSWQRKEVTEKATTSEQQKASDKADKAAGSKDWWTAVNEDPKAQAAAKMVGPISTEDAKKKELIA